jgi:hypothetical protein
LLFIPPSAPWHRFDVPDEWLQEAGVLGFRADTSHYPAVPPRRRATWPVVIVSIAEIAPVPKRRTGEAFDRARLVSILIGLRSGATMEALEIDAPPGHPPQQFRLRHGYHRFHACLVVGFSLVPAVVIDYFRNHG